MREGDRVVAGALLVTLEGVGARAEAETLTSRLRSLAAREARLRAERSGSKLIHFGHPSLQERDDPEVDAVIAQETNQLEMRRANDESRKAVLSQRVAQLRQQITGSERQLEGVRRQMELIEDEMAGVRELLDKGLERKPRLLALQRTAAELIGTEGELVATIARAGEAIGETELQIINLKMQRIEEIDAELADIQADRIEVEKQLRESLDRLSRTALIAPVDGTVLDIRFKTPGGVIRPGEPVLDIVPSQDELIIDARLSPKDIDDVHAGLSAHVMFPSYPQRHLLRIAGTVARVSADTLEDERSGEQYYLAKIQIDADHLAKMAPEIQLTPGLPAEVFITTADRTMLEYLTQPFLQSLERSFREQ